MINGREFAERFYSETCDYEEEKLYSTGNDEIDELLERAFCDGYEYAQKEYAEKEEKGEKKHTGAKVAAGVGGAAVVGAGGVYGGEQLGKLIEKKGEEKIGKAAEINARVDKHIATKGVNKNKKAIDNTLDKAAKLEKRGKNMRAAGDVMQTPMRYVRKIGKKIVEKAKK